MSSPKNCLSENQVKCHEKPYSLLRKIAMNPKEYDLLDQSLLKNNK